MIKIEFLDKSHDRNRFDCRNTQLNTFLKNTDRQHITKGMSRTFVLINDENPKEILGFYTLSICEVETDYLPPIIAKKYPDQVPALKLARLAVSKKHQHKGYGNYLIGRWTHYNFFVVLAKALKIFGLWSVQVGEWLVHQRSFIGNRSANQYKSGECSN